MKKFYILHHQEILHLWKNFMSSIINKFYNDMASNFGTNLKAWTTNSHAGRQTNVNSQGELQVASS
jgi:hypothetical protein